ncbi:hypothetical protein H6501_06030 [Candidatus Woesearchaeota archaeon]|nr:hypothetical protein [Nanoarchaeota archaeon]MCB9371132.1 hypothetical protein [Candidatus Woesearchaeota archaeon]USN43873.1 MAG: hypothetical protein H6500_05790 [Candidatus Woesearchaeota archaeon]
MFRKSFVLTLLFFVLFSSCSLSGGSSGSIGKNPVTTDRSGLGLEMSFSLTESRWANGREFEYDISLKNSGLAPIELDQSTLKLVTVEGTNSQESYAFDSSSLQSGFYDNVFEKGSLLLEHDQTFEKKGTILVGEDFFSKQTNQQITYFLTAEYTYTTEFDVEIEVNTKTQSISPKSSQLSQAAPIQVTSIELNKDVNNQYQLLFYIEDKGGSSQTKGYFIPLENVDASFGTSALSSCQKGLVDSNGKLLKVADANWGLSSNYKKAVYVCDIDLSDSQGDTYTTKAFGSFSYTYKLAKSGTLTLKNEQQSIWADETTGSSGTRQDDIVETSTS